MTSHSEFVRDVVKQYGIVALAKSMVQDQKSYGLDELSFTRLATEHAQRLWSNDRPDVAFSNAQLKELGRRKWPTATEAQQFERAFTDPANATLAAKAHRRPTAPPGGAYPFPR